MQQKAMAGVVDFTLKFALSALWNLTDETPTASRHFIQCQGLELYEEVLEVGEAHTHTFIVEIVEPFNELSSPSCLADLLF